MKGNRKEISKEIREIERRIRLIEKKAASLRRREKVSPREAFKRKFPDLQVDPELFKLVGIDPPLSLSSEKKAVREAINLLYESK